MKTIILDEPGHFSYADTPEPGQPGPGEALIRVRRIGICGTDLHAYEGTQPFFSYPRILGHELGVEVVAVGAGVTRVKPGDRCAVEPYLNCGKCIACRRDKTNCCTTLEVLGVHIDGGMREQIIVPADKLHRSDKLTLEQLALVETLCIGAHAVRRAQPESGENVLVVGAGPIGLTIVESARTTGANIILMDINEGRLQFARENLGVELTVNAQQDPVGQLRSLLGDLPTMVFEATGSGRSMHQAFSYVAHGGTLVLVGLMQGDITFNDPEFHRHELTLMSSRNATAEDFYRVISLLESGVIDTTPWITHRAAYDEMIAAFPGWLDPANGVIKAMVEM